jgi:gluconokinase
MSLSLVVMGVAGCGKSSLGSAVAEVRHLPLLEGDAFHSPHSIEKMRQGIALTDEDRAGWLRRLQLELQNARSGVVLSCSALRRVYRDQLREASPGLRFAFLDVQRDEALRRVQLRASAHFFRASLVDSQFETLESPVGEPGVLRLDATAPLAQLLDQVNRWWQKSAPA